MINVAEESPQVLCVSPVHPVALFPGLVVLVGDDALQFGWGLQGRRHKFNGLCAPHHGEGNQQDRHQTYHEPAL